MYVALVVVLVVVIVIFPVLPAIRCPIRRTAGGTLFRRTQNMRFQSFCLLLLLRITMPVSGLR
jgi:hypothetical protein